MRYLFLGNGKLGADILEWLCHRGETPVGIALHKGSRLKEGQRFDSLSAEFKIPKLLQDKTNDAVLVEVQGGSVQACIADLIRRYPDLEGMILDGEGRLFVRWMVCIDNQSTAASNELSYQVKDGDIITLLPMVAGG